MDFGKRVDIVLQETDEVKGESRLTELEEAVLVARGRECPGVVVLRGPVNGEVGRTMTEREG
jgi:hypothetical protein